MTLTIVPTPSDAKVTINGEERGSITMERGAEAAWEVSAEGYVTQSGTLTLEEDTELPVTLEEEAEVGPVDGVYVAYVDANGANRICAAADWDGSLGEAQGVLVGDGAHEALVAPAGSEGAMQWGLYNVAVEGAVLTGDGTEAKADYAGRANTAAEVAAGAGAEDAAGWCDAYSHGNAGSGEWWLPACGELEAIRLRLADVNAALAAIGGEEIPVEPHWSSTQYSATSSYPVDMSDGSTAGGTRTNTYLVRAVSSFKFEGETDGGTEPASLSASRRSRRASKASADGE